MIDSTYVKAQRTASSLRSDGLPRALGRSKGGITTKIHLLCDEQGRPKDFIISAGQIADIKIAPQLVKRNKMSCLLADRAYDVNALRNDLERRHIRACIPPKSNRKIQIQHDPLLYRKRHVIENMFSRLKDWKGIAFRSNRCAYMYQSSVTLAPIILFL